MYTLLRTNCTKMYALHICKLLFSEDYQKTEYLYTCFGFILCVQDLCLSAGRYGSLWEGFVCYGPLFSKDSSKRNQVTQGKKAELGA